MSFTVVKNTIPTELAKRKNEMREKRHLAMTRGLEVFRSEVVKHTPIVTSRLVHSIQGHPDQAGDSVYSVEDKQTKTVGVLGTNVPYARRVEFGFVGQDKLGRNYDQKGRYYFTRGFLIAKPVIYSVFRRTLGL